MKAFCELRNTVHMFTSCCFCPPGKQLCEEERRAMQAALDSIVCHTPLNNLGFSRKGSALTFSVAFQALRTGLFEVGWGEAGQFGG